MEPLDGCTDQQIGAAVRDIQKDSRSVLERMFSLKPLRSESEGTVLSVPSGFDAGEFKLTGNVAGNAPYQGELMHSGWKATKTDVPSWNGDRYRDVSDEVRSQVLSWMEAHETPQHHIDLVRNGGVLDAEEQDRSFGEALPPGLHISG